jgi:hypothetical protein
MGNPILIPTRPKLRNACVHPPWIYIKTAASNIYHGERVVEKSY